MAHSLPAVADVPRKRSALALLPLPNAGRDEDAMTVRRVVVDHVLLVVQDLAASRRFYRAALAPLGIQELKADADGWRSGPRAWTTSRSSLVGP